MLEKDFSFKQRLNSFAKIGDKSGLIFLRTTTLILSGLVVFFGPRLFMSLETSLAVLKILLTLCSVRSGELKAKIIVTKSFALSNDAEIVWGYL